jgi:hypothetical protein
LALLGALAGASLRRVLQGRPGNGVDLLPARVAAYREQGDSRFHGGLGEGGGLAGSVQLDRHGGCSVPPGGTQRGGGGTTPGADREDQLTGVTDRCVLGVEQGDAADLDVQPGGCRLQLHQGLAQ